MFRVKKRDGKIASFDINKIKEAIKKAFVAKEIDYNEDIIDMLALKVSADFARKIKD